MKFTILALCCALLSAKVIAAPPSDERAERLLAVLQTAKQLDDKLAALEAMNRRSFAEKISGGQPLTTEQQAALDRAVSKVSQIMRTELAWSRVKPGLIRIVQETFEQDELDGILNFYSTPAGKALLAKFPQVEQRSARHVLTLGSEAMKKLEGVAERELEPVESSK